MNTIKLKNAFACLIFVFCIKSMYGQLSLAEKASSKEAFSIVNAGQAVTIYYDRADADVVEIAANLLAEDIERVTDSKPKVISDLPVTNGILIGSLNTNILLQQLVREGKLDAKDLKNGWERYTIQTIKKPFTGVDELLVIAGSDRRGTAYGVFELSKTIGVSPWYWWADVPVVKRKELMLTQTNFTSKAPSVKYRGVFLNDEDWGLKPWASKLMDPEINDIGQNTYAKVCELLLRLKANMLAPAMHEVTGAFFKYPENKVVADKYAIMMTSSHAEPLLYNNTTEWDHDVDGDWDYVTNKKGVLNVLDKRVQEAAPYENIYTVGMRGIHDTGMKDVPEGYTKANVLEQVIEEERVILSKYIEKPADLIPQIFVPYKEVLDIYRSGMQLPEDVTLVWPDDNFGYIKKLSDPKEARRRGGAGVYYHISYLGEPNDYLWLNTTPPALMYEEMYKAYQNGADRYWLLNVGDIKPGELGMQFFLDLAWDINSVTYKSLPRYNAEFLATIFGEQYIEEFQEIYNTYFHLGFERKPEYMGWDWRWNSLDAKENIIDTEFSFANYNEAENRIQDYTAIANKAGTIYKKLPEAQKSAYYQLVYYPVVGAYLENVKMLTAQKNRWYAQQGRAATNDLVAEVQMLDERLSEITATYNNLENGKWKGIMTAPGRLPELQLPPTVTIDNIKKAEMGIFIPNSTISSGVFVLPQFSIYTQKSHSFEIYNKGNTALSWKAEASKPYIKLSKSNGKTNTQDLVEVSIEWSKVPEKANSEEVITIISEGKEQRIYLSINSKKDEAANDVLYVEENGVVVLDPSKFSRKTEKNGSKIQIIDELGYAGASVQLGSIIDNGWANTSTEYDFYADKAGYVTIQTYALPVFGKDDNTGTAYGVQIDNSRVSWEQTASAEYSFNWKQNVIRNATINSSKILIDKPGKHTLKLIGGNPGMVIQKVVIDFGGLKDSYMGPDPTFKK
ncbi:glycosyl hydrolase 115 family protein [Leeuwenhoekiella sp. NPDC079379]|uniref:glycosyl hydrolase 115 family protein n=1 Tax=Leeuwenhoekiella sp. NPDC079379 TaxID=3364122 RepID=UPI0037C75C1D